MAIVWKYVLPLLVELVVQEVFVTYAMSQDNTLKMSPALYQEEGEEYRHYKCYISCKTWSVWYSCVEVYLYPGPGYVRNKRSFSSSSIFHLQWLTNKIFDNGYTIRMSHDASFKCIISIRFAITVMDVTVIYIYK